MTWSNQGKFILKHESERKDFFGFYSSNESKWVNTNSLIWQIVMLIKNSKIKSFAADSPYPWAVSFWESHQSTRLRIFLHISWTLSCLLASCYQCSNLVDPTRFASKSILPNISWPQLPPPPRLPRRSCQDRTPWGLPLWSYARSFIPAGNVILFWLQCCCGRRLSTIFLPPFHEAQL